MRLLFLLVFSLIFCFSSSTLAAQWAKDLRVVEPLVLKEYSGTPTPTAGYGSVYAKTSDNALYFMDSLGNEFNILLGLGASIGLNYLSDVDVMTAPPTTGQALVYDGSVWVPGNISSTLGALSDVDLVTVPPTIGKVLGFDGSKWVPAIGGKNLVAGNGITIDQDATTATISSSGKVLVGTSPIVITQDSTTATFSFTQDASNRLVSDVEKNSWDSKVNGTGTTNSVSKWSATSTLTNSTITDDGTTVRTTSDFRIDAGKYQYFGDPTVNNSFRVYQSAGSLIVEKRISGTWSEAIRVE